MKHMTQRPKPQLAKGQYVSRALRDVIVLCVIDWFDHGCSCKEVAAEYEWVTGERVEPSNLYGVLRRLRDEKGWIHRLKPGKGDDKVVKSYVVTARGVNAIRLMKDIIDHHTKNMLRKTA